MDEERVSLWCLEKCLCFLLFLFFFIFFFGWGCILRGAKEVQKMTRERTSEGQRGTKRDKGKRRESVWGGACGDVQVECSREHVGGEEGKGEGDQSEDQDQDGRAKGEEEGWLWLWLWL